MTCNSPAIKLAWALPSSLHDWKLPALLTGASEDFVLVQLMAVQQHRDLDD